ncbi:MAG: ABC transporter ATP-binding protein [Lachnospiraceae bacterium]|nr:ABC transporter ATP-binding protein [Lachnospiraceae bacterium]
MSEPVLEVKNLCKRYPSFYLDNVSFSMPRGVIMGFIGRNGAGKTTTIKSILNLVHKESGEIRYFGLDLAEHEQEIKERIGYAGGAVDYYKRKKIRDIVSVTKTFYKNWDENAYRKYMDAFELSEDKTPGQLSEGMKVKMNLTLSLSHQAELLILDEPTSGLDPISREELLDIFKALKETGVSILFSTHITSDLDKCADLITYIKGGKILASEPMDSYLTRCRADGIGQNLEEIMLHFEKKEFSFGAANEEV